MMHAGSASADGTETVCRTVKESASAAYNETTSIQSAPCNAWAVLSSTSTAIVLAAAADAQSADMDQESSHALLTLLSSFRCISGPTKVPVTDCNGTTRLKRNMLAMPYLNRKMSARTRTLRQPGCYGLTSSDGEMSSSCGGSARQSATSCG